MKNNIPTENNTTNQTDNKYGENNPQSRNQSQQGNQNTKESPITLPKGGGAIQGMGEKFQANPVTGTGSMNVPINMSQGRAEFTPQLALSYDSGSGNSAFGLGWNIGLPQITRKTQRELPKYNDINTFPATPETDGSKEDTFILSGAEDLVAVLEEVSGEHVRKVRQEGDYIITYYRPRTEGLFAKIERWYNTTTKITHWRSISKENITTVYGESENARISDPAKATKIFKWLIERSFDAKGNIIYYEYKAEDGMNLSQPLYEKNRIKFNTANTNKYLTNVLYGNKIPLNASNDFNAVNTAGWHFRLNFNYGEYSPWEALPVIAPGTNFNWDWFYNWKPREDSFSVYSPGFEIRTYRLCRRIEMYHNIDTDEQIVKMTELSHNENQISTQLNSVTHKFYKENEFAEMPPLDFIYSTAELDPKIHKVEIEDLKNIPAGIDNDTVKFADINATGIPGLLIEDKNAWYFKENLGDIDYYGTSVPETDTTGKPHLKLAPIRKLAEKPSLAHTSAQNAPLTGSLTDIDGDGIPELMIFAPPFTGYYKQEQKPSSGGWRAEPEWEGFRPFSQVPNINMGDPNMRTIDITGDGNPDLLITEQNCFVCYPSAEEKGWEKAFRVSKTMEEEKGPAIVFNDGEQSIYLADMSGDGMTDIVRIKNGSIVYWANLGYGRFSAKITMSKAPHFDRPELFNQSRIRIADIDGSGTADILYLGSKTVNYWLNQSGNSFSEIKTIKMFPQTDNLSNIFVTDFLGNGTSCIVWSSPLPGNQPHSIRFIDLMSGTKPYLLVETDNNTGAVSRYQYTPSTKFYLKHKAEGNPWKTKLPFPVQVLERSETYDKITDTRFVSLYEYRDGYYDGYEREFRGFGMVEQRDTEKFASFAEGNLFTPGTNTDEESHIPPVLSKTWFHLGTQEQTLTGLEPLSGLTFQEKREAYRALRGSMLKQEIYAEDDSSLEELPYSVTEKTYELKLLQKQDKNKHAVFFVTEAETRTIQSERDLTDARIMQSINLETDNYGNPLKTAQIAYPRGFKSETPPTEPVEAEQTQLIITVNENEFINEDDNADYYLLGILFRAKVYDITGLTFGTDFFTKEEILSEYNGITSELLFEEEPETGIQKRRINDTMTFYADIDGVTELAIGTVKAPVLQHRSLQSVFTETYASSIYETYASSIYETQEYPILKIEETLNDILSGEQGKYEFITSEAYWYKPSEKITYKQDLFFLPEKTHDIFGNNPTVITYDSYGLLPVKVTDVLNNEILAENDYRVLQARKMTDINLNTQEVEFDTRGMVIATVVQGKNGEGDTLAEPTTQLEYDLFNFKDNQKPNYVKTTARTRHVNDELVNFPPLGGTEGGMVSYTYTGGLGQEIMTKVQAEDRQVGEETLTDQWVGTGRTVLNNKGKVVKQYEPYFSATFEYETEDEMPVYGVTPIMHYDSLGRPIRTDLPDGTFTKVEFTPWEVKNYDTNDTVLESDWYAENDPVGIETLHGVKRAAYLAAQHANTPQTIKFDTLGREFLTTDDNGLDENDDPLLFSVRNTLDITGNITKVTDAKGREMTLHKYDMAGRLVKTYNIDSGTRIMLPDAADKPLRQADSRGHILINSYDELQRPVSNTLSGASSPDRVIMKTEYGTSAQTTQNLNGQAYKSYDQSGITTAVEYDFKGNPLQTKKEFCHEYENTIDWNANNLITNSFTNLTLFDALNRAIKQTKPDSSILINQFNKAGLLEKIQLDHKGQGVFADYVTNIDYNEKAQRTKIEYGNGTQTTYTYNDKNFRLTNLKTVRGSDILQDISYIYDPEGNITEINDAAQQTIYFNKSVIEPKSLYEYDALYRLKKATGREHNSLANLTESDFVNNIIRPEDGQNMRNFTQEYQYDEIGNIIQMKSNGVWTREYKYNFDVDPNNNNYLLNHDPQSTTDTYLYDTHGNMTKMPHLQEMKYDYADQLNEVTLDLNGNKAYYVYDAGGDRVRKVVIKNTGTIVEDRFYIGDYEIYTKKTNGTLDTERETLHIQDDKSKVALIDYDTQNSTTTVRYQYTNHLDSASLELDETGAIITYEEYHPFGTTSYRSGRSETEVSLKRYKYVHKELDNETGLYYYGMRYYAPWIAKFISVDPLQFKYPHYTPYQYAGNKPISNIDLDGAEELNKVDEETWKIPLKKEDSKVFNWTITDSTLQDGSNKHPFEIEEVMINSSRLYTKTATKKYFAMLSKLRYDNYDAYEHKLKGSMLQESYLRYLGLRGDFSKVKGELMFGENSVKFGQEHSNYLNYGKNVYTSGISLTLALGYGFTIQMMSAGQFNKYGNLIDKEMMTVGFGPGIDLGLDVNFGVVEPIGDKKISPASLIGTGSEFNISILDYGFQLGEDNKSPNSLRIMNPFFKSEWEGSVDYISHDWSYGIGLPLGFSFFRTTTDYKSNAFKWKE